MANDITGSCEIGESVELIPDAVDDILPPGYLNEGTLPIDTTEQDIGVDPAGGMAITGECTECPPGFTWGCCAEEPAFPTTPPIVGYCRIEDTGYTDYYNFSEMFAVNDGANLVIANYGASYGLSGYMYTDAEMNKIYTQTVNDIAGQNLGKGIIDVLKVSDTQALFFLSLYFVVDGHAYRTYLIDLPTGTVVDSFPPPTECTAIGDIKMTQYDALENCVYYNVVGTVNGSHGTSGLKYSITSKSLVLWCQVVKSTTYSGQGTFFKADGNYYLGVGANRNPDLEYYGELHKFNADSSYNSLFHKGTVAKEHYGTRYLETEKYIIVMSGYYRHLQAPLYNYAYDSYYTYIYLYDKQMNFVKQVIDTNTSSNTGLSNLGFGYSISEYGNYILIGTPGRNLAALYDSDFNYLYPMNTSVPIMPTTSSGMPVLMTKNKLYFGQGNTGIVDSWDFKICDYTQ